MEAFSWKVTFILFFKELKIQSPGRSAPVTLIGRELDQFDSERKVWTCGRIAIYITPNCCGSIHKEDSKRN